MRLPDPTDTSRIEAALCNPEIRAARVWLAGDRPSELRSLLVDIAAAYASVENASPPEECPHAAGPWNLTGSHPWVQVWPEASVALRQLMFTVTQLYRSAGVLVAGAGYAMNASIPATGRSILEGVGSVRWITEPLFSSGDPAERARAAAIRWFLTAAAGLADLLAESRDFQFGDFPELTERLRALRQRAVSLFGQHAVNMGGTNPRRWSISGEGLPSRTALVEGTGSEIFCRGAAPASHYRIPSAAAHASLGSSLGTTIEVDHGGRSHLIHALSPPAVEGWLWYLTIWYRWGGERVAAVHGWDSGLLASHDGEARAVFGRSVLPFRPPPVEQTEPPPVLWTRRVWGRGRSAEVRIAW